MTKFNVWILTAFLVYMAIMLGIGFLFSKKSSNLSDYFLGGRKMGSWVTALSAQASDMSSWLMMGLPGAVYLSGLSSAWIAIGLTIGTYLNWKIVAARLRKYSFATGDAITIPQYLQNRFNENSVVIRVICAIIIFVFFLVYTASGFSGAAKLIENVFGINYATGLTISVIVILIYTLMGGYFAVVWTDFFQGMLLFFSILIVPITACIMLENLSFESLATLKPNYLSLTSSPDGPYKMTDIISNLGWGLGYFGMPHILVRFMSAKDTDTIKKSRIIAMIWVILSFIGAVSVGIIGYAYLSQNGIVFTDAAQAETVFLALILKIAPGFIAGVLLCSIVSAIMSTSDSQLLVTASAVSSDFYQAVFKKNATDKELLFVSKIAVGIVGIIAYILAINPNTTIMSLVSYAWAGFGAAFGPTILFSLFWKRMTMMGAAVGMVSGGLGVVLWKAFFASTGIYEIVPAFILSCILIVIVSLCGKKPSKEIEETFDSIKDMKL